MSKNPGIVLEIIDGIHAGKYAIAYHKKQEFMDINKLVVTIFDDDNFTSIHKENVLIGKDKVKHIGFSD